MTSVSRAGLAATAVCALLLGACSFEGYTPGGPPKPTAPLPTTPLALDQPTKGEVDCPAGRCTARYRIEVRGSGELTVRVKPLVTDENLGMRITLEDPIGRVLDTRRAGQDRLQLESVVDPGPYDVLIQAIGGAVPFEVAATLRGGPGQPTEEARAPGTPTGPIDPPLDTSPPPDAPGSSQDFGSAYDPDADFTGLRKYAFDVDPAALLEKAPPGSDVGNPFLVQQVQRTIRNVLAERGYEQVAAEQADMIVHTHAGANRKTWYSMYMGFDVNPYSYWFNEWRLRGAGIVSHTYSDGTIVIDVLTSDRVLLWHGWKTEPVPVRADSRALIQSIVRDILAAFPPTKVGPSLSGPDS